MWAAVPSVRPRATIESLRVELACPSASVTTACLVDGDQPLLIAGENVLLGGAGDNTIDRLLERRLIDHSASVAHAEQGRLVDHVGQLGAAESGGLTGDLVQRYVGLQRALCAV
jgi:hypothetical protein